MTPEQERALAIARARRRRASVQSDEPTTPAAPTVTDAQRQEVGRRAISRQYNRGIGPMGVGGLAQIATNTVSDPARWQEVANSAGGFVRDLQQVPNLDLGRVATETGQGIARNVQGFANDPGGAIGRALSALPQLARGMTYGPFQDEEAAQQRLDLARLQSDTGSMASAAREANSSGAAAALNVFGPLALGGGSVARAGLTAAAIDAPFALSRNNERPLQERLPAALTEMTGAAALGAGAQGIARAAPIVGNMLPSRGARMVARMDRAGASVDAAGNPVTPRGVSPSLATANSGVGISGPATKMIGDNIVAGVLVRPRVQGALRQTRDAARDIRDAYGRARSPEAAGNLLQRGLTRFANEDGVANPRPGTHPLRVPTREWPFPSKARAVFDLALRPVERNPAQLTNTSRVLGEIRARADSADVQNFLRDPVIQNAEQLVARLQKQGARGQAPTLRDLREVRRKIRLQREQPGALGGQGVENAALGRIEAALTEDIYAAAGPAADDLRRADAFYRRHRERVEEAFRAFDPDHNDASIGFRNIIRAADRRTGNTRALAALRSALPDSEWRTIAASLIDEMGTPTNGAAGFTAELGFSIDRFANSYRAMSPQARRILFGSRGGQGGPSARTMRVLADDLDNLAEVALAQKGVERSANFSGSGRDVNNYATFGLGVANLPAAAGTVLGLGLTGEMLTNPAFVRWLVSAQKRGGGAAGMRSLLPGLARIAARDPSVLPAYEALQAQLQDRQRNAAPAQGDGQTDRARQTETMSQ